MNNQIMSSTKFTIYKSKIHYERLRPQPVDGHMQGQKPSAISISSRWLAKKLWLQKRSPSRRRPSKTRRMLLLQSQQRPRARVMHQTVIQTWINEMNSCFSCAAQWAVARVEWQTNGQKVIWWRWQELTRNHYSFCFCGQSLDFSLITAFISILRQSCVLK